MQLISINPFTLPSVPLEMRSRLKDGTAAVALNYICSNCIYPNCISLLNSMAKFALAPYSIRVKERRTTDKYVPLSNIPTQGSLSGVDLLDLIHHYFDRILSKRPHSPDEDYVLKVDQVNLHKRVVNGRLKCGHREYSSELVDTKTGNTDYHRTMLHAEIVPYYFLIGILPKANKGIIILQKFNRSWIKDVFLDSLYKYFKLTFGEEYTLEMTPLVPRDLIREYIKGRITKIRLIKQELPRDPFDVDSSSYPDDCEFDGEEEYVLKARRNGDFPKLILNRFSQGIEKFLSSENEPIGSIIEYKSFEFDNVKVEVQIGGHYTTIDISHLDRMRYSEDISGIEIDTDGHPKFGIIDDRAKEFLQNLALGMFGSKFDVT